MKYNIFDVLNLQESDGIFNRFDIMVRYCYIEDYFNNKKFGINLYKKMQEKRKELVPRLREVSAYVDSFNLLIQSFKNSSEFKKGKPIIIKQDNSLIDGSHRLACCLYFNIGDIHVKKIKKKLNINYSLKWFVNSGFTDMEIRHILNKKKEIFEKKEIK